MDCGLNRIPCLNGFIVLAILENVRNKPPRLYEPVHPYHEAYCKLAHAAAKKRDKDSKSGASGDIVSVAPD